MENQRKDAPAEDIRRLPKPKSLTPEQRKEYVLGEPQSQEKIDKKLKQRALAAANKMYDMIGQGKGTRNENGDIIYKLEGYDVEERGDSHVSKWITFTKGGKTLLFQFEVPGMLDISFGPSEDRHHQPHSVGMFTELPEDPGEEYNDNNHRYENVEVVTKKLEQFIKLLEAARDQAAKEVNDF